LDEFRTSLLNYKNEEICKNLYLPDKKGILRKLHSVLTYKMENNRYGCIQRDINSVKNMKKIVAYWLVHKKRPEKYRRSYVLKQILTPASSQLYKFYSNLNLNYLRTHT
jgi:hypothetical protein